MVEITEVCGQIWRRGHVYLQNQRENGIISALKREQAVFPKEYYAIL